MRYAAALIATVLALLAWVPTDNQVQHSLEVAMFIGAGLIFALLSLKEPPR